MDRGHRDSQAKNAAGDAVAKDEEEAPSGPYPYSAPSSPSPPWSPSPNVGHQEPP
jgi:hypothetical protein